MSLPPRDDDSSLTTKSDRRAHPRRTVSPRLFVVLYGANSDGILYDVSEGGAALDIIGSQPEGEYVVVDFEMAEIGRQFEAKARITWRDEVGKKVGIHFEDLPEASRNQLKEWLLKKAAVQEAAQSAFIQDAARDVRATPQSTRTESHGNEPPNLPARSGQLDSSDSGDKLAQNLIASFSRQSSTSPAKSLASRAASIFSSQQIGQPAWTSRKWIPLTIAACVGILVVLGVVAYRSPARNVGINVSKVGQLSQATDVGPNGETRPAADTGATNGTDLPSPGVPPPVSSSLATTSPGSSSCLNLGAPSDEIRIYLWSENNTPAAITAAYAKQLKAVLDVRIVDKAPYDLVLYVNGAAAGSSGPNSGYMWSSRVFRPWYCGPSLGLLEQTQVNESLHYVEGANLDRHVQSEVAYLILHTFETVRKEHNR